METVDFVASYPLEKWEPSMFDKAEGIVSALGGESTGCGSGFGWRDIEYTIPIANYEKAVEQLTDAGWRVEQS
jgi:hypothetical protein